MRLLKVVCSFKVQRSGHGQKKGNKTENQRGAGISEKLRMGMIAICLGTPFCLLGAGMENSAVWGW